MDDKERVAPLVARVSEVVAARLEEVAAETGVSYHTLYAWARGRRTASSRHLLRLAEVVRRRAALLQELAAELEVQAAAGASGGERTSVASANGRGYAAGSRGSSPTDSRF